MDAAPLHDLSFQVLQLAAGEAHTLALTASGKVYTWGRGSFGRLGTGTEEDQLTPTAIDIGQTNGAEQGISEVVDGRNNKSVVSVAAGAYHSLALDGNGTIWSWGYNVYGQLGHIMEPLSVPHPVSWDHMLGEIPRQEGAVQGETQAKHSKIVRVEAGGMISCAIDEEGKLWMWGYCPGFEGEDMTSTLHVVEYPMHVSRLQDRCVSKVSCGNEHVLVSVTDGTPDMSVCYAWGNNSYGQLGLGDVENRNYPEFLEAVKGLSIIDVACGAFHSAIITSGQILSTKAFVSQQLDICDDKNATLVWTFGLGGNGQLGHGTTVSLALPDVVKGLPENQRFSSISCGLFHSCAVTDTGSVWVWGMEGGLGLCPGMGTFGDALFPIEMFNRSSSCPIMELKHIVSGAAHTVTLVDNGFGILAWGRGQNGVLGTGQLTDSASPCSVLWPPVDAGKVDDMVHLMQDATHQQSLENTKQKIEGEGEATDRLRRAMQEISSLKEELQTMKAYVESLNLVLHGGNDTSIDEWDRKLASSSVQDLLQFESFYRFRLHHVKDILLERKVKQLCKSYLLTKEEPVGSISEAITRVGLMAKGFEREAAMFTSKAFKDEADKPVGSISEDAKRKAVKSSVFGAAEREDKNEQSTMHEKQSLHVQSTMHEKRSLQSTISEQEHPRSIMNEQEHSKASEEVRRYSLSIEELRNLSRRVSQL